jgi:hypothetical protein
VAKNLSFQALLRKGTTDNSDERSRRAVDSKDGSAVRAESCRCRFRRSTA